MSNDSGRRYDREHEGDMGPRDMEPSETTLEKLKEIIADKEKQIAYAEARAEELTIELGILAGRITQEKPVSDKKYPLLDNLQLHVDIERWDAVVGRDIATLTEKDKHYGGSWKRRGGVGAFMMMARKHDRLEQIWKRIEQTSSERDYDIFKAIGDDPRDENILDDIRDLRCYLILVEAEVMRRRE